DLRPLFADLPAPHPALLAESQMTTSPDGAVRPAPGGDGEPVTSGRSAVVAGILQLVVPFGVGRFYTGQTGLAVAQLLVTLLTFGLGALWPMIDGILLLVNGGVDGDGRPLSR
ncbi:TM2 domain-containing protein, partial [Saccharomonospora iraqiensis]|uniref:TM2 domain-containing protein n=1 Tax=Saccharomonospora iraqiensis TaxID=52698 RepID=UPI001F2C7C0C